MTKLTLQLTRAEMERLRQSARRDLREPKAQALHLLRTVLSSEKQSTNANSDAVRQDKSVAAATDR